MKALPLIVLLGTTSSLAQSTFQNLDFESAIVPDVPSDQFIYPISLTNAVPGWTGYYGTNQGQFGSYNGLFNSARAVGLIDGHTSYYSNLVSEGYFTAVLQTGNVSPSGYGSAGIGQTGLIPLDARSLLFNLQVGEGFASNMVFTINGAVIPFTQLQGFRYGADVSGFAGQIAEIRFTEEPALNFSDPYMTIFLDNIQFSSTAIPEPQLIALLVFGGPIFWINRRWRML